MKRFLRKFKRLLIKFFGSKIDEIFWRFRNIFDKNWPISYITNDSLNHPHRIILIEKISDFYPFESALELGCASGVNLFLLSKKFPKAKFYGIDISKKAIEIGKGFLKNQKVKNVFLKHGKIEDIKKFKEKSIDIIFTDATLIYVDPKIISCIVEKMIKVAKKAIILCEQHTDTVSFYNDVWIHNYRKLFSKFIPEEKIKFTKISPKIWSGNWGNFGYIIEVKL
jgi:ubiquinone/menaquinone biosynthesis C-methylase UbiE